MGIRDNKVRRGVFEEHGSPNPQPPCHGCGEPMLLAQISPVPHSQPLRLDHTYECECGVTRVIESSIK
jgi:hypothetical protein